MSHVLLRCTDLTICYQRRPAVHHLNLELACGSFVGVVGPNGAGKSTWLQGILGWLPLTGGTVTVADQPMARSLRRLTYLPQKRQSDVDFPVTVEGVVAMGRYQHRGLMGGFTASDQQAINAALAEMGLTPLRQRPLAQLSGGQQQRVFLARALATGADILLLDEPLAGLDAPTTQDLLQRLRAWATQDRLVIAVIHDLAAVRAWCTHVVLMNRHLIATGHPAIALTDDYLRAAYGPTFISNLPASAPAMVVP
ncbi:MAG: ABC transporter ATP-binding protein [Planctomycetes bacterium]|nr:ABC transporter ATP-binding protein [Planctomycetota bacterium]